MSHLLPDGIRRLRDAPARFHQAVRAALMFLGFEDLASEDRPPRSIWLDGKKLSQWFDDVRRRQKEGLEGRGEIEDPVKNSAIDMLVVD